jgi:glycerate-2-kinase
MCLIAGGETTVTIKGSGKGGRNQELALSAAKEIQGVENCLLISLATDGEDGPTDAAGGAVDGTTLQKGIHAGMDADDYLRRNDAYSYLHAAGALIRTGPTGTNVNDLVFMFAFNS